MAFAPCTRCGQGFKGGASTFFPAVVKASLRASVRHKVCPACSVDLHMLAEADLVLVSEGDKFFPQEPLVNCLSHKGPLGADKSAFFLNEYARGEPERQFYGQVCDPCVPVVVEQWGIPL